MLEPALPMPGKLLLATDMSARCDRAFDRAVQLARAFGAELVAAHVLDPADTRHPLPRSRRPRRGLPDPTERMRWHLERDLASTPDAIRVIVEEGDTAEKLIEIAQRENCDLVVTGTAGAKSLSRMLLGSTINRLLRALATPVLVVHDKPHGPYCNILVASDLSDASFQALNTTGTLFPRSRITLFHGYDLPYEGIADGRNRSGQRRPMENALSAQLRGDERIDPELRDRISIVVEYGTPEVRLGDYVDQRDIDLTVIGSHGRGAVFDALIGSTAKRLVESLESDLLVVRYAGFGA